MIILRWKPLSFQNIRSFWNLALGMGNLNIYENIYEDGILYGVWESGPWAGFKMPKVSAMGWIGGGTAVYDMMVWISMHFNASQFLCRIIQVWRHTCLSISSSTGKFKLVENGEKAVDKVDSTIIEWMNDIPKKVCISIMTHSLKNLILLHRQPYSLLDVTTETQEACTCQCMGLLQMLKCSAENCLTRKCLM